MELSSGPGPAACQGCRRGGRYVQEVNGWNDDEEGQLEWVYGIPQGKRKVVIELGSNDGQWIYGFMTNHPDFWPIIVEAQPVFRDALREIARDYQGVYMQRAAWITDGETLKFYGHSDAGGMGSSLYSDSVYHDGWCEGKINCSESLGEEYEVQTLDVVELIKSVANETDFIILRMDVEGAEYEIARKMIASNVACWIDYWELEGHAMYAPQNHKFRPVDSVLPWLLRACGVDMRVFQYYKADPKLMQQRELIEREEGNCSWQLLGYNACSEAGSCQGITET
uniref:Methyltransferase FkbM domain-containing protein n=1 Tax=Hanusia phi TaxID=3032 RepID=A0A7S0DWI2_9CRYP